MNDCINCKHSRVEKIWGNMECRLKDHMCTYQGFMKYSGKQFLDGRVIDCQDGVKCERN